MQNAFHQYIIKHGLFSAKDRLLLAFSGGVDSVVLAHLLKDAGYKIALAHCNFNLRGDESDVDEAFAKSFAQEYEVEIFVKKFDTKQYALDNKLSTQVAARELRYNWFNEIIKSQSPNQPIKYLLTAHHADDNIETVLMNFCKGTGISGLKGILPKQNNIVRPLLFATKESILAYAKEHHLQWREDSSNSSDKYTRNYFRNLLIPGIEKVFPQVRQNISDNIERFTEVNEIYKQAIAKEKKALLLKDGNELKIPVLKLQKTIAAKTVLFELLKDFGFTSHQVNDVYNLTNANSGKYVSSATHRVLRNRAWLIISPLGKNEESIFLMEKPGSVVELPIGKIECSFAEGLESISKDVNIAQLNAKDIAFPLIIRKWKQGDYFYPLGMYKKKKLSRFFIDNKLSLTQKENTWVVESNKKILWVIGQRIDNRFKINTSVQEGIVILRLIPFGQEY